MCKYSTTAVVVRNIKHYFYRHLNPLDSEYLIDVAIVDSDMFDFNANNYGEAFISDESEQALIMSIGPRQIRAGIVSVKSPEKKTTGLQINEILLTIKNIHQMTIATIKSSHQMNKDCKLFIA